MSAMFGKRSYRVLLCTTAAIAISVGGHAWAALPATIIARVGDPLPGGGTLSDVGTPTLNDLGVAAFVGRRGNAGSGPTAILRGDGGPLTQILEQGQAGAGGNGTLGQAMRKIVLSKDAQVASFFTLSGTIGGATDNTAIVVGNGGPLSDIAREGRPAPDGNGSFTGFSTLPTINDVGEISFTASLTGINYEGVYRGDAASATQIARSNQASPDGVGFLARFSGAAINTPGDVAFVGSLVGVPGGFDPGNPPNDFGIFRGDGSTLTKIVRKGQAAPVGGGVFRTFPLDFYTNLLSMNDDGEVGFVGTLDGTSLIASIGVFRGDGGALTQIARGGAPAPDGNGVFQNFLGTSINNSGLVSFQGELTGTALGLADRSGIFLGDGGALTQVARMGQASPDGNGVFDVMELPVLNDGGQVAFYSRLTGTSGGASDDRGIFLYDPVQGIIPVIREGDPFLGSTIVAVTFALGDVISPNNVLNGLNNRGQVAFEYVLANGGNGIAVTAATIPEPASAALVAVAAVGLIAVRRRRLNAATAASWNR